MEQRDDVIIPGSVELCSAADIVQHSLFVRNSITPLNLELSQDIASYTYSNEIITTEEKCRRILAKRRGLLDTLHLDLPTDSERSLRRNLSQQMNPERNWRIAYAGEINVDEKFYLDLLSEFVWCSSSEEFNFKVLKWFLTVPYLDSSEYAVAILNCFLDSRHYEQNNIEFLFCCLRKIDFIEWLFSNDPLENGRIKRLIYQWHFTPRDDSDHFVDGCILFSRSDWAAEVLKLRNAPRFNNFLFIHYWNEITDRFTTSLWKEHSELSRQRDTLLIQVFWVYVTKSDSQEASEFLRLIWSSVPDACLTFREIETAFRQGFSSEEPAEVFNFYSEAVGAPFVKQLSDSVAEPRSLKHYCRTTIRGRLVQTCS